MFIKDKTLFLNEHDLKMILMHIGLVAESCSDGGGEVEKLDFVELFKDSLKTNVWYNVIILR